MTVLIHTPQVEVLPRETGMPGDSLGIRAELWGQLWNPTHRTQEYCTQIYRFKPWATHTQEWCLGIVIFTLLLLQLLPNTPLSSQPSAHTSSQDSEQAQQRAAGSVPCRLPKGCSPPCETQAALWEGCPIPDTRPDAAVQTQAAHSSGFPALGREWGNAHVATEGNSTAKIYLILKVIATLCWGLVVQNYSIQTTG